jgi:cytoplasmic iron level regulating protein YaaA (DUF328/UPF0246 family)
VLIVVSPAKALDFESPLATRKWTVPTMMDEARQLVAIMKRQSPDDLSELMSISPALAELNFERFQDWEPPTDPDTARPAVLAFNGDTYQGLNARGSFDERDFTHAQKVLRILSGLHGVLRPLDLIHPYRLEMGSKVKHGRGGDLYSFWGDKVTDRLNRDLARSPGSQVLVNLASQEYFGAIQPDRVDGSVVTPTFLDAKDDGDYGMVGFFAKRARGAMAGWIVRERIRSATALVEFDADGYVFSPERSTPDAPVFLRHARGPTL